MEKLSHLSKKRNLNINPRNDWINTLKGSLESQKLALQNEPKNVKNEPVYLVLL
jgi:hypothetical protein